jgi:hypothetical protein
MMQWHDVESSNLESVGFDSDAQILGVRFKNRTTYHYFDVPEPVFQEFLDAPSKGQFLERRVKGVYRYERV